MDDIVRVIGSRPYGVSLLQRARLPVWTSVLFQETKAIIDAELNTMQQVIQQRGSVVWSETCGDGLLRPLDLSYPIYDNSNGLAAIIHSGSYLVTAMINGSLIELRTSGSNEITVELEPPIPDLPTYQVDLVYLEAWNEEIQPAQSPEQASSIVYTDGNINSSTVTNDLFVAAWGKETARRVQLRYAFRVATNTQTLVGLDIGAYSYQEGTRAGEFIIGNGTHTAGAALSSVDGYRRAIPLAILVRNPLDARPANSVVYRIIRPLVDAQTVDSISASATPTANMLLPLDSSTKIPVAAIPYTGLNVDTVDDLSASATRTAGELYALDGTAKISNAALKMGSDRLQNGIDLDTVDTFHASQTPTANTIPVTITKGRLHHEAFPSGIQADRVDNYHASATPSSYVIPILSGSSLLPLAALPTGHGGGINADKVDGFHASFSPQPNTIPIMDNTGKLKVEAFPGGHTATSTGINADTLDGLSSLAFSTAAHTHGGIYAGRISHSLVSGQTVTINNPNQLLLQITPHIAGEIGRALFVHILVAVSFRMSALLVDYQALQLEGTFDGVNFRHNEIPIRSFTEHRTMLTHAISYRVLNTTADSWQLLSRYNGAGNVGIQYLDLSIIMIALIMPV